MPRRRPIRLLLAAALAAAGLAAAASELVPQWTAAERELIGSLSLSRLPPLPADPSNRVADDPAAAALGEQLFGDTRLSANGSVACATCHLPERQFQDDIPLGTGVGLGTRRTMPVAGTAYSPWLFWDGRSDSQWAQALAPLENPVEHGSDRLHVARVVAAHYRPQYEALFGPLPELPQRPARASPLAGAEAAAAWARLSEAERDAINTVFANAGKAIAAFERTRLPTPSRFDAYADALAAGGGAGLLSAAEERGLRLFIGKGNCIDCHNGPLFTDNYFHNTGVPAAAGLAQDQGRAGALAIVANDPFNCLGPYSDAAAADCAELRFMASDGEAMLRAFKPPSLRGVADRPPYMHAGQFATLDAVLAHYNAAPAAPLGRSELVPLGLGAAELADLAAFLAALDEQPREQAADRKGM